MCTAIELHKELIWISPPAPPFEADPRSLDKLIITVFGPRAVDGPLEDRFNIRISDPLPVIPNDGTGKLDFYRFGLIPSWSKDAKIGNRLFNARSETVAEKPSFRAAIRRRRCIVVATGFYEWPKYKKGQVKRPFRITTHNGLPFGLAGLWETWTSPTGDIIRSANILTCAPNEMIADYHDRMPVILHPENYADWLAEGEVHPDELRHLFRPYPSEKLYQYKVSDLINNPRVKTPETIQPYREEEEE